MTFEQQPSAWSPPSSGADQPIRPEIVVPAAASPVPPPAHQHGMPVAAGMHAGAYRQAPPVTDRRDPGTAVVVIAWIIALVTFLYMLPWAIAASRGRSNQAAIGVINLLLGWTLVGWIVALVMACQAHQVVGLQTTNVVVAQHFATGVAPAGWYPAPDGIGQQYWDGANWTAHRA